jgi:hypothetical protein
LSSGAACTRAEDQSAGSDAERARKGRGPFTFPTRARECDHPSVGRCTDARAPLPPRRERERGERPTRTPASRGGRPFLPSGVWDQMPQLLRALEVTRQTVPGCGLGGGRFEATLALGAGFATARVFGSVCLTQQRKRKLCGRVCGPRRTGAMDGGACTRPRSRPVSGGAPVDEEQETGSCRYKKLFFLMRSAAAGKLGTLNSPRGAER